MNIAENYNEFVKKVAQAERTVLNTKYGQELTSKLLKELLKKNPNMTENEWKKIKNDFMTFIFFKFIQNCPEAMNELAHHTYNAINTQS